MSKQPGTRLFLAVFVLAIIVLPVHVFAETSQPPNPPPERAAELLQAEQSEETPSGEVRWFTLTIQLADELPVKISVPERGLASYKSYRYDGVSFGVIPVLRGGEEVELHLVSISGERPNYRATRVLETLSGRLGFELVGTATTSLPIEVKADIVDPETLSYRAGSGAVCDPPSVEKITGKGILEQYYENSGCCVSCGGGESCGCTVETSCGSCTGTC